MMTDMENRLDIVRNEGGVELMKASAGSGKTFSLAREYIRVLLSDNKKYPDERNSHRHILAVTFTNKATEEMKSRIVKELDILSRKPQNSPYCNYLCRQCGFADPEELRAASEQALYELLSDYGSFSVSTIDSFFQRTLRAFSRELGHSNEYRVEMDRRSLINEAVDRFWDSLSSSELLKWVVDCAIEKVNNGEGLRIEEAVKGFAHGYLSAAYEKKIKEHGIDEARAFSEKNIKALRTTCKARINSYCEGLATATAKLRTVFDSFSGTGSIAKNPMGALRQLESFRRMDKVPECLSKQTLRNLLEKPQGLVTGKAKSLLGPVELENIRSAVEEVLRFGDYNAIVYQTSKILLNQISVFRVASSLRQAFDGLLREKNVFGLDDTNAILKDIIDGSDAPFIYEKTGTWYRHFLLDEFQDTSSVQWECFRPLLKNSIAEGMYNLIVGDVKQSIYRWRDAEWNILGEKVGAELDRVIDNPLNTNWRSSGNVIRFNNAFYRSVAESLDSNASAEGISDPKSGILYQDVKQEFGRKDKGDGRVRALFCASGKESLFVVDEVLKARERNYRYRDIAVLVRKNTQGTQVASALASAGIPIITNDSLAICSSKVVSKVVSALCLIDNPTDAVHVFGVGMDFDPESVDSARSLSEMADILFKQLPAEDLNRESLYVLAFMDLIRDYVANNGNSLHGFLKYWEESGMSKAISSPRDSDAVTIITIHKSKGLDYPFVIVPLPIRETSISVSGDWYVPGEDPLFDDCEKSLYNISPSADSLFRDSYFHEAAMSQVDFINTWYVATTRAESEMCIIGGDYPKNDIRDYLRDYCESHVVEPGRDFGDDEPRFVQGISRIADPADPDSTIEAVTYDYGSSVNYVAKEDVRTAGKIELSYLPEGSDISRRGSVRISNEAADYFHGEGEQSARQRGIVLHGIMQHVNAPAELHEAVEAAVECGRLRAEDAGSTEALLAAAMDAVQERGWFDSAATVYSEAGIISAEENCRPDRVVIHADRVDIVDYKFGTPHPGYRRQVQGYMDLFGQMGYKNVHGYLWFVADSRVEEVFAK